MNEIQLAIKLMGYGLTGVFTVLIVFFLVIRALRAVFPYQPPNEGGKPE